MSKSTKNSIVISNRQSKNWKEFFLNFWYYTELLAAFVLVFFIEAFIIDIVILLIVFVHQMIMFLIKYSLNFIYKEIEIGKALIVRQYFFGRMIKERVITHKFDENRLNVEPGRLSYRAFKEEVLLIIDEHTKKKILRKLELLKL